MKFIEGRRFKKKWTIAWTDEEGRNRRLEVEFKMREENTDDSVSTINRGANLLSHVLIAVDPLGNEFEDINGHLLTDPEDIRQMFLRTPTLAKGAMECYWDETIKKKEL